jgi:hypothetical protein
MAIYSTLYGLPQSMVDYLNQPLPSIQQPYILFLYQDMIQMKMQILVIHKVLLVYTRKLRQVVIVAILFSILIQQE